MEQPLHPGSTVHHGGFINFFIHACQRRNINDGVDDGVKVNYAKLGAILGKIK